MTSTDREILRLAVPAFLALVAEPMFLLADAAIVGRLGNAQLAGLGIAGAILQTLVGLCVFLAYGTTASVARHLGAGDLRAALTQGVDGCWLAVLIGGAVTVLGAVFANPLVELFGAGQAVSEQATAYLSVAIFGTTPLLLMLASTGVLRGLQDTRTPLLVAVGGNLANIVLNVVLVFGLDLGIAGSALGSVIAQIASAAVLVAVVVRSARREGAPLRPDRVGVITAALSGIPLVLRTLTLRACLLVGTYAVTIAGRDPEINLATHQIAITLWTFLAFALDALAIAAQAITGRALGAGDIEGTRRLTRRMVRWGYAAGFATGLLLATASPFLGPLFSPDPEVHRLLVPILLVAALGQPIAGVVFVLDGVLIGAGDGAYLARAGLGVLLVYAPAALLAARGPGGLVPVWLAMTVVFMGARFILLTRRARGDAWLRTGSLASRP